MPGPTITSPAASVFVLRRTGTTTQVLLLKRADTMNGTWCQVAGKIEQGETAWHCVVRELFEETALQAQSLWSADICEQFYVAKEDSIQILPVFVAYVDADAPVTLNHEHTDHAWLSLPDAMARVSFASQRHVLRHITAEFLDRTPVEHLRIDMQT